MKQRLKRCRGNGQFIWLLLFIFINIPISLMSPGDLSAQSTDTITTLGGTRPGLAGAKSAVLTSCEVGTDGTSKIRFDWTAPTVLGTDSTGVSTATSVSYEVFGIVVDGMKQYRPSLGTTTATSLEISNDSTWRNSTTPAHTLKGYWIEATNNLKVQDSGPTGLSDFFFPTVPDSTAMGKPGFVEAIRTAGQIVVDWVPLPESDDWTLHGVESDGSLVMQGLALPYVIQRRERTGSGAWSVYGNVYPLTGFGRDNPWTDTMIAVEKSYQYIVAGNSNCGVTSMVSDESNIAAPPPPELPVPAMHVVSAEIKPIFGAGAPLNIYWRNTDRSPAEEFPATPKQTVASPTSGEAVRVHSLRPDSTYEFTVTLTVSGTEIASPDTVSGKTNLPMIPLGLAVKDSSTSSVTLTWTPREYAVEYNIRHSSDAGTSWATLNDVKAAGSPNGFEVTGLTPGTAYQFQVRTEYSDENKDDQPTIVFSDWSGSVSQSTVTIVAGAPTSAPVLTAVASSDPPTNAVLTWDSIPTADIGDGATSVTYEVQGLQTEIFPDPFPDPCTGDCWEPPDTAKLTVTHEGLTPGHLWYYRVRAKNDLEKTGPWSATKSVQLAGGLPAKPELTARVSGHTVILVWTEPDSGSSPITGYELEQAEASIPTEADYAAVTPTPTERGDTISLEPSTDYSFRVRAINDRGSSDWDVENVTTGTTSVIPSAVKGFNQIENTGLTIHLKWRAPDSGTEPIVYEIQQHSEDSVSTEADFEPVIDHLSVLKHDFIGIAGKVYTFRVRAKNTAGEGQWSEVIVNSLKDLEPGARPAKVTVFTAERDATTNTTINLSWTAPDEGTSVITDYKIETKVGAGSWTDIGDESTATTYAHTGTDTTVANSYRVSAINAEGTGPVSDEITVREVGAKTAPLKVPSLTATRNTTTNTTIDLTWTAPGDGGSPITGYKIEVKIADAAWKDQAPNTGNTTTTYTHTETDIEVAHIYRVSAINAEGTGPPSDEKTVPKVGAPPPTPTKPGVPRDLQAVATGKTIALTWTAPAEGTVTGYRIEFKKDGGAYSLLATVSGLTRSHTGLDADTKYFYKVQAENGDLKSDFTSEVSATTEKDDDNGGGGGGGGGTTPTAPEPSAPRNLTAVLRTDTEIRLNWDVPASAGDSAITGYRIHERAVGDDESWQLLTEIQAAIREYIDRGLDRGVHIEYRVAAISGVGLGAWSNTASAQTIAEKPSAPTEVAATAREADIEIQWSPPHDDGGSAITGYRIDVRELGGTWTLLEDVGVLLTYIHRGLDAGETREYRVRAQNSVGTGPYSDIVSATTELDVPGGPREVAATARGTTITITWDPPANDGGLQILGYRLDVRVPGEGWSFLIDNIGSTRYVHEDLPAGATREYRVRARNSEGLGPYSDIAIATLITRVAGPPIEFAALSRLGEIELRWDPPDDDGGSDIIGYRLQVRERGKVWALLDDIESTTYVHRDLPPGATREYRVRARNSEGLGTYSITISATANTDTPSAPRDLRALVTDQDVRLEWRPPVSDGGSSIGGYQIEVSLDDGESWSLLTGRGSNVRLYFDRDLLPGARRVYRIQATNSNGGSPYSNVVRVSIDAVRASAPRDLLAEVIGQDVELRWLEPSISGGGYVTGYRVEISTDGRRWSLVTARTEGLRYLVENLTPDELRFFRVAALNEAGIGIWSDMINATPDPTVPDSPGTIGAIAQSSSRISIAWNPPRNTGGRSAPITGYRIESHSGGEWIVIREDTRSLHTTFVHGGREPGTKYFYRISAINRMGVSAPSTVASATTFAVIPNAPTGLTVTAEGSDRLRLRWDAPGYDGGGAIIGYQIEAHRDGEWSVLVPHTYSTSTRYLHVRLEPAETWRYRVSAINEIGVSEPTPFETGTTHAIVPDSPHNLRAEPNGNSIELRWQTPNYTGGSRLIGYGIVTSPDGTNWELLTRNTNSLETVYTHGDLPPATTRYYQVFAINAVGASRPSLVASATTEAVLPGSPEAVVATAVDHEMVWISWDPPQSSGGSDIIGYRIDVSENDGRDWETLIFNTGDEGTIYRHDDLTPATVYNYRVSAINSVGTGPFSAVATVRTHARVSDPPINLVAEAVAPNQIDLDWDPPEYDGGSEITGYQIEISLFPENSWEIVGTTERSSWSHEDLTPGDTWYYRVSAINEAGISEPSEVVSATTDDTADRIARLNTLILPRFASAVSSGIVRSISDRMDAIAHHRAGYLRVGSPQSMGTEGLSGLLDGAEASQSFGTRISAWGNVDKTSMGSINGNDDIRWDGEMLSFFTGSDIEVAKGLYVGLSASHSSGSYDVIDNSWNYEVEGRYRTGLTNVTPYVGWIPAMNVLAWASGSYGLGEIEIEQGARDIRTSSTTMRTGAGGLIGRLTSGEFGSIKLRVEGWVSELAVEKNVDFIPMTLNLRRVRTALEWTRLNRLNGSHEFSLLVNGGLRHDFNENIVNHSGFEFGGGAGYSSPSRKLRLTATGRMLITTDADYNEWGIGGGVHIEPSSRGGLGIRADPTYGSHRSGVEQLWASGVPSVLSNERQFFSPVSVEYLTRSGAKPYLRFSGERAMLGFSLRGLSTEVLGGSEPGLSLKGSWTFD